MAGGVCLRGGSGGLQYPGEKEITFPPFTCLEVDGDPRVEWTKEGEVVVFPLKVASNNTSPAKCPSLQRPEFFSQSCRAVTVMFSNLGQRKCALS